MSDRKIVVKKDMYKYMPIQFYASNLVSETVEAIKSLPMKDFYGYGATKEALYHMKNGTTLDLINKSRYDLLNGQCMYGTDENPIKAVEITRLNIEVGKNPDQSKKYYMGWNVGKVHNISKLLASFSTKDFIDDTAGYINDNYNAMAMNASTHAYGFRQHITRIDPIMRNDIDLASNYIHSKDKDLSTFVGLGKKYTYDVSMNLIPQSYDDLMLLASKDQLQP